MPDASEDRTFSEQIKKKFAPNKLDEKIKTVLTIVVAYTGCLNQESEGRPLMEQFLREAHSSLAASDHCFESDAEFLGRLTNDILRRAEEYRLGKLEPCTVTGDTRIRSKSEEKNYGIF